MKDLFINAGNNYCSLHKVNSYFLVESSITVQASATEYHYAVKTM